MEAISNEDKIMLDNVAAGVGSTLDELVYIYQQIQSKGMVQTEDIRQFAGRGIPIFTALSRILKVDVASVSDLLRKGEVRFEDVQKSFQLMTSEGAQFYNLRELMQS